MKARIVKVDRGNYNIVTGKSGIVIGTIYEGDSYVEDGRRVRPFYSRGDRDTFDPACSWALDNAGTLTQLRRYLPHMVVRLDFCTDGCGKITNTRGKCSECAAEVARRVELAKEAIASVGGVIIDTPEPARPSETTQWLIDNAPETFPSDLDADCAWCDGRGEFGVDLDDNINTPSICQRCGGTGRVRAA